MHEAENALVALGFSLEQWMLIKKYLGYAIVQNQIVSLKSVTASSFDHVNEP
jgi:hypothetical protein